MEGFKQATVTRDGDRLTIRWQGDHLGNVKVYQATDADFAPQADQLVAQTTEEFVTVQGTPKQRDYFMLVADNGAQIRTAERVIKMDSLVNFRDLGGYLTTDGRRTKWGKLLRSAAHDAITDDDVAFLQAIGLKTVVDYRSTPEEQGRPDREIQGVSYKHIRPLEDPGATDILNVNHQMESEADAIGMLTGINRQLVKSAHANSVYRDLMHTALDGDQVPMVQHCTAGKDRVGVGSATLLLALGVPKETIIADYLLSNENQLSVDKLKSATGADALPEEKIRMFQALAMVRAEYIEAFFDEVEKTFGGVNNYFKEGLGITDDELAQMKIMYLEEM